MERDSGIETIGRGRLWCPLTFEFCSSSHFRRTGNMSAHYERTLYLSDGSCSIWLKDIPEIILVM